MLQIENAVYKISDYKVFSIEKLEVYQGGNLACIGRNGSGKSMLVKALSGELTLLSGRVDNQFKSTAYISFEQLQKLIDDEWKRNNTDMLSEGENDIGLTTEQIIQENSFNQVLCQQLANQFGIGHLLTRRFKYLSTGETRKTLICRVLMQQPDLLILDEPFDGLDVASRENLAEVLADLAKQDITVILVLNRFNEIPSFIKNIGILADCQLLKIDTKDTILNDITVKQLVNLENIPNTPLPEADEPPIQLTDELDRIILNNGYVHYDDKAIINGLTWQVKAKQNWQIVGPNGAGKSTLLSLITGDHPQGYCNDLILFGRKRGSGETIWDIKRHIGYVSSSLHLDYRVNASVKTVLLSGYFDSIGVYQTTSDKQTKLADEWLKLLGLQAQADKPFQSLSWGQQRLVLIARALVKHPTLLILDEPLQGLDHLNRELVKCWIDRLISEGHTQLLFVSHHAEDAPKCITHRLTFVLDFDDSYQYQFEQLS
ncbi:MULTISPECIES: molybdate ABC transporter ATP-binding protein ModF [unclassified Gilliamella]|uniref:molybdate ABC transporter ATP-binding protein ModF n=1 Tax=unclassified Gilliamella TaxID=2685620 RepID=UPI00132BAC90|nr:MULTISPECIES: molybdate ABC transporter ATP-binding protein ModF [unclassified Gilliamella]MWN31237.1 molybdate ABC transporter ATP-binding protein ModF [Gilliamella sp. Pra-s60]MWP29876.1 molybdate ABC transporter ATP-binding protein ModF [Gilliamella sp. Pra-s54]MWP46415.1 molybdate ABC transporter ATP-binding protein ModF [Gilliamella sp. Pas-s27]